MWSDECYFNIEGECEFFRDWLTETKDEVIKTNFCMYYFLNNVVLCKAFNTTDHLVLLP